MAVLAVGGEVDRIARALERRAQLPPEIGLVFNDQDTHCWASGAVHVRLVNPRCVNRLLSRNELVRGLARLRAANGG